VDAKWTGCVKIGAEAEGQKSELARRQSGGVRKTATVNPEPLFLIRFKITCPPL
jgi:hypothetical protein